MAHKGEMKKAVPGILHARKFRVEAWLYWIGACHAIVGAEVERLVGPLAVDIDKIIELRFFWWRLDILRLQNRFDEFIRLCADFHLQRFGERSRRCFAWIHRPPIDFLWHPIPPCHAGMSRVFLSRRCICARVPAGAPRGAVAPRGSCRVPAPAHYVPRAPSLPAFPTLVAQPLPRFAPTPLLHPPYPTVPH